MEVKIIVENKYVEAVGYLSHILSENEMEIINDALQCYGRHPEDHSYDEEIDDILKIAFAFDLCGYNAVVPEHDILRASEP